MTSAAAGAGATRAPTLWLALAAAAGAVAGVLFSEPSFAAASSTIVGTIGAAAVVGAIVARPILGVYALVVAAPFTDGLLVPVGPFEATPLAIAAAGCALGWAFEYGRRGRGALPPASRVLSALALLPAAALVSLPLSLAPAATASHAARLIGLTLMAAFVGAHVRDRATLRRVLALFVGVSVLMAAVALVQRLMPGLPIGRAHVQALMGGQTGLVRPGAFYVDPNFLGGVLVAACAIAGVSLVRSRRAVEAAVWASAGAACAAGVLVTASRSALVSGAVALAAVIASAPRRRALALVVAVALALLVAAPLLPVSVAERLEAFAHPFGEGSTATRYLMVGSTLEIALDHWTTGTGLAAFDRAYPAYRRPGSLAHIMRPHELPLALPAEMGLGGLLAESALLAALVWTFGRRLRAGLAVSDAAVAAALASLLAGALFQYYLYLEPLWLLAAVWAAAPGSPAEGEA